MKIRTLPDPWWFKRAFFSSKKMVELTLLLRKILSIATESTLDWSTTGIQPSMLRRGWVPSTPLLLSWIRRRCSWQRRRMWTKVQIIQNCLKRPKNSTQGRVWSKKKLPTTRWMSARSSLWLTLRKRGRRSRSRSRRLTMKQNCSTWSWPRMKRQLDNSNMKDS